VNPTGRGLVLAKAPVPGRVKTRLAATVGDDVAASLAAAALLDTVAACSAAFEECHLALDGDLGAAVGGEALLAATSAWHVFAQSAGDLGARLAHAHASVGGDGPVVQVAMDTPQATATMLRAVAERTVAGTAVVGPTVDGGWWVLGLADMDSAGSLVDVEMSRPDTGEATRAALVGTGLRVLSTATLRDVDTAADAAAVASVAPGTRFASVWRREVA
jgi:glycosyltransferase A (GT-A) superfamily protein (DUF2064 family)